MARKAKRLAWATLEVKAPEMEVDAGEYVDLDVVFNENPVVEGAYWDNYCTVLIRTPREEKREGPIVEVRFRGNYELLHHLYTEFDRVMRWMEEKHRAWQDYKRARGR